MGMQARSETLTHPETTETASCKDDEDIDEDEFYDCLSWGETDLEVGVDVGALGVELPDKSKSNCKKTEHSGNKPHSTNSLPKMFKDTANCRTKWLNRQFPPHKTAPDGTTVHYWCEMPTRRASFSGQSIGMFCPRDVVCSLMI